MRLSPRQAAKDVILELRNANIVYKDSVIRIRIEQIEGESVPTAELRIGLDVMGTFTIDKDYFLVAFEPKGHLSYGTVKPYLEFFEKVYG